MAVNAAIHDIAVDETEERAEVLFKMEPHSKCGGDGGAGMLCSIFNNGGEALYELMHAEQHVAATRSMVDLVTLKQ